MKKLLIATALSVSLLASCSSEEPKAEKATPTTEELIKQAGGDKEKAEKLVVGEEKKPTNNEELIAYIEEKLPKEAKGEVFVTTLENGQLSVSTMFKLEESFESKVVAD